MGRLEDDFDENGCVTEAAFRKWLTPAQALIVLRDLEKRAAAAEIIRRASMDRQYGAANISWKEGRGTKSEERALVPREWWEGADALRNPDLHFWSTGGYTFKVKMGSALQSPTLDHECFDVKFEPRGIYSLLPKPPPQTDEERLVGLLALGASAVTAPPPEKTRRELPRLADTEMDRFARIYLGVYPDGGTEAHAHRAAVALYEENFVPRDYFLARLRVIRGHKNPGKTKRSANSRG